MTPLSRMSLSALIALSWSSLALADTPSLPGPSQTPIDFASVTRLELDTALEELVEHGEPAALQAPSGPTRMACRVAAPGGDPETCTVTAPSSIRPAAPAPAAPAALAAH